MKKKRILLILSCLILTAKPFGMNTAAAQLSGQTVLDSASSNQSDEPKQPEKDDELKQPEKDDELKQPEKDDEEIQPGKDDETIQPGEEAEDIQPQEAPYKTRLSLGLPLYKGDTTTIGIRYSKTDVYEAVSSDPSVVKISKQGKIKALKCGKADIKVVLENGSYRNEVVLHVRVKASSFTRTGSYGQGAAQMKTESKTGLVAYREVAPGGKLSLKTRTDSTGTQVTYRSSDDSIAKVDSAGTIMAKKQGACTIRVLFKDGKNKTVYRVRLYVKTPQEQSISNAQKDAYFNASVMVGNSLGVGLASYCRQQYAGFLGNTRHFSSGSFSLMNDMRPISATSLHPTYNGIKYKVKDALRVMGAQKAFLSFGMNDLNIYGVKGTADVYQQFIRELQNSKKGIAIYIVSQTPIRRTSGQLENGRIREFNRLMEVYASKTKDVYYIDIFPAFLDRSGLLASQYCSDGFCHLTNAGYAVWTAQLKQFAGQQIMKEIRAKDALETVKESCLRQDYKTAKRKVKKLDLGKLRTKYMRELETVKRKLV